MRRVILIILLIQIFAVYIFTGCAKKYEPVEPLVFPFNTFTVTETPAAPVFTPTNTFSTTPYGTVTITATFTQSNTPTFTMTPSCTYTNTEGPSSTSTNIHTMTATRTSTLVPTSTLTSTSTPTIDSTPGPAVSVSGTVYQDEASTIPISNATITVYEIDATALRVGGPVAVTSSDASGNYSVVVDSNRLYEFEASQAGGAVIHNYPEQILAAKSGLDLFYTYSLGATGLVTGGMINIHKMSGTIRETDTVTLDGSGNLNNPVSSNGSLSMVSVCDLSLGAVLGLIDVYVSDGPSPGIYHSVSFNGDYRSVRVYTLTDNHSLMMLY